MIFFHYFSVMFTEKKTYTPQAAQSKAEYYCAYQERSQQEVRNKLYEWGLHSQEVEQIIAHLISENFLNEERFALAYARGKFQIMHWGKIKIKMHLKQKKVPEKLIQKALNQIDDVAYSEKILELFEKKSKLIKEKHPLMKQKKIISYLLQKGYELEVINFSLKNSKL